MLGSSHQGGLTHVSEISGRLCSFLNITRRRVVGLVLYFLSSGVPDLWVISF